MADRAFLYISAKSDPNDSNKWLPLWMHLKDTAGVMDKLLRFWVAESSKSAIGLEFAELRKAAVFLAQVHDIGKCTSVFQSRILQISRFPECVRERLYECGLKTLILGEFANAGQVHHALAGETILEYLLAECGANQLDRKSKSRLKAFFSIVGAHHGKPQDTSSFTCDFTSASDCQFAYDREYFGGGREYSGGWKSVWNEVCNAALADAGYASLLDLPALTQPAQVLLSGLLIMADWLASNTEYFPLISIDEYGQPGLYPGRVNEAWHRMCMPHPWHSQRMSLDDEDFLDTFGFCPNQVQRSVIEAAESVSQPGIMILEAQMGVGKTEAALAAAEILGKESESGGVFFGLPTQATSNAIFERFVGWLDGCLEEEHAVNLVHSMAGSNELYRKLSAEANGVDDDGRAVFRHRWFNGRKLALLPEFVVGTVDQLLLSALKQKGVMLKHLGLSGKVVIVDECHAYDAYMNQYLKMALTWLGAYKVPVIILSATLPSSRRADLIEAYLGGKPNHHIDDEFRNNREYPLLTWTDGTEVKQLALQAGQASRKVEISTIEDDALSNCLNCVLSEGGCAGVIVNTVKRAQEIVSRLHQDMPDKEIILCHSRFVISDRLERESLLLGRIGKKSKTEERNNLIVVGTQVLEQSLDIDFDFLVTDLCPMDLLLQRIGRLHRHKRSGRPEKLAKAHCCVICNNDGTLDSGSKAVYGEWLLRRTYALLPKNIVLPDDIANLVQSAYDNDDVTNLSAVYPEAKRSFEKHITEQEERAKSFRIPRPDLSSTSTLVGWLYTNVADIEEKAEAAVRDGDISIEVILLKRGADGCLEYVNNVNKGHFYEHTQPSMDDEDELLKQRVRLPMVFCVGENLDAVIRELEDVMNNDFSEWQHSSALRGQLILRLDENCYTKLCKYNIKYSKELGFCYEKEVLEDDKS